MKRRFTAWMIALSCLLGPAAQAAETIDANEIQEQIVVEDAAELPITDSAAVPSAASQHTFTGDYAAQLSDDPVAAEAYRQIAAAISGSIYTMDGNVLTITYRTALQTTVGRTDADRKLSSAAFRTMLTSSGYFASIKDAFAAYRRDHPEVFYLSENLSQTITQGKRIALEDGTFACTAGKTTLKISTYFASPTALRSAKKRFSSAVSAAVSDAKKSSSRYHQLRSIHDFLCQNAQYEEDTFANSAYGALNTGYSKCEGYANAFKVVCDKLNIPCVTVSGQAVSSTTTAHMWNAVQMPNGSWYAVDVTWDDVDSDEESDKHTFFLVGSSTTARSYYNLGAFATTHIENGRLYDDEQTRIFSYPALSRGRYWAASQMTLTDALTLEAGSTAEIDVSVKADASVSAQPTISEFTAASSDDSIAQIDIGARTVTAGHEGSAALTVRHVDGPSAVCQVQVLAVRSLSLPSELTLVQNKHMMLTPTIEPSALQSPELTWKSSDDSVVAVDDRGTIRGISAGTAVITVTSKNGISAQTTVTVSKIPVESIALTPTEQTLPLGQTLELTAETEPAVISSTLRWQSSEDAVASVDENGTVTAQSVGTAVLTAEADGVVSNTCTVQVIEIPAVSLRLNKNSLFLIEGHTEALQPSIQPSDSTDRTITWHSDHPAVASVSSDGTVTARRVGTAELTAVCGANITAKCTVTVVSASDQPELTDISNTPDGVSLSWKPVSYAGGYAIAVRSRDNQWESIGTVSAKHTSFTHTDAESGRSYTYTVFPLCDGSPLTGFEDNTLSIRYLGDPKLTGIENARKGLKISWQSSKGATGYRIFRRSAKEESFSLLATVDRAAAVSYIDTTAANRHVYAYTVQAYGNNAHSAMDTSGLALRRVSAPSFTAVSNTATRSILVKWSRIGYTDGYEIIYSTSPDMSRGKTVSIYSNNTVRTKIAGLKKGKVYYLRIRSYKGSDNARIYSAWSSRKSIKIAR